MGLDLIVPFLDKKLIDLCMKFNQRLKRNKMEKHILRKAFEGYLPDDILWRQKDGMSDAVGTNWVDEVKKYAEDNVDDVLFKETKTKAHGHNPPLTKEEALYRNIFWK